MSTSTGAFDEPITFSVELEFALAWLPSRKRNPDPNSKFVYSFTPTDIEWEEGKKTTSKDRKYYACEEIAVGLAAKRHMRELFDQAGFLTNMEETSCYDKGELDKWEVANDVTVTEPEDKRTGFRFFGFEVKTPILTYGKDSLTEIRKICELIQKNYVVFANNSTGLHVHCGRFMKGFDLRTLQNLTAFFWAFENQLSTLHPSHRLKNPYCVSARESSQYTLDYMLKYGRKPDPATAILNFLGCAGIRDLTRLFCNQDTMKLSQYNMCGLFNIAEGTTCGNPRPTIEFRQHASTIIDPDSIICWVGVCVKVIRWVMSVDASSLMEALSVPDHELWTKQGDGQDTARELKFGPALEDSGFTIIDLLTHIDYFTNGINFYSSSDRNSQPRVHKHTGEWKDRAKPNTQSKPVEFTWPSLTAQGSVEQERQKRAEELWWKLRITSAAQPADGWKFDPLDPLFPEREYLTSNWDKYVDDGVRRPQDTSLPPTPTYSEPGRVWFDNGNDDDDDDYSDKGDGSDAKSPKLEKKTSITEQLKAVPIILNPIREDAITDNDLVRFNDSYPREDIIDAWLPHPPESHCNCFWCSLYFDADLQEKFKSHAETEYCHCMKCKMVRSSREWRERMGEEMRSMINNLPPSKDESDQSTEASRAQAKLSAVMADVTEDPAKPTADNRRLADRLKQVARETALEAQTKSVDELTEDDMDAELARTHAAMVKSEESLDEEAKRMAREKREKSEADIQRQARRIGLKIEWDIAPAPTRCQRQGRAPSPPSFTMNRDFPFRALNFPASSEATTVFTQAKEESHWSGLEKIPQPLGSAFVSKPRRKPKADVLATLGEEKSESSETEAKKATMALQAALEEVEEGKAERADSLDLSFLGRDQFTDSPPVLDIWIAETRAQKAKVEQDDERKALKEYKSNLGQQDPSPPMPSLNPEAIVGTTWPEAREAFAKVKARTQKIEARMKAFHDRQEVEELVPATSSPRVPGTMDDLLDSSNSDSGGGTTQQVEEDAVKLENDAKVPGLTAELADLKACLAVDRRKDSEAEYYYAESIPIIERQLRAAIMGGSDEALREATLRQEEDEWRERCQVVEELEKQHYVKSAKETWNRINQDQNMVRPRDKDGCKRKKGTADPFAVKNILESTAADRARELNRSPEVSPKTQLEPEKDGDDEDEGQLASIVEREEDAVIVNKHTCKQS